MGYYQGDFYRGARGDPGFWSYLGGIAKTAVGMIPGVGPVASAVLSKVSKPVTAIMKAGGQAIIKHPVLSAAGAAGALGVGVGAAGSHMMAAGGAPGMKGYHLCKSMRHPHNPHPCKTGEFVRNRKMNVCNPRALRRAVRRATGFAKLAMRTIHLVHPKKKARFGGFRRKRAK